MRGRTLTTFRIAVNNLRRRPLRSVCLAALAALLSFVLIGGSLLAACLMNGTRSVSARLGADALLVPAGYEAQAEGALLRGEPSAFFFDGELAERLLAVGSIEKASPQLMIASFDSPHCSIAVQMLGYDPASDFVVAPWLADAVPGGPGNGEVVVGSAIIGDVGDTLTFFSRKYTVAGKLEKTGMGFDASVFVNMSAARTALEDYAALGGQNVPAGGGAVSAIAVDIRPETAPADFARGIRYDFRGEGVGVILTKEMFGNVAAGLNTLLAFIAVLVTLLWLLAIGALAVLFTVTVNERKRELGVYRALGATRRKLAHIVLTESAVVSFLGTAAGAALLGLFFFSFSPLLGVSIDLPYLQPSASLVALLLLGGGLVSFLTGPLASLFIAARIGRIATHAIMREGE